MPGSWWISWLLSAPRLHELRLNDKSRKEIVRQFSHLPPVGYRCHMKTVGKVVETVEAAALSRCYQQPGALLNSRAHFQHK